MTINDLREQFKKEFHQYVEWRRINGRGFAPGDWPRPNMRQSYQHGKKVLESWDLLRKNETASLYYDMLTRFVRAGDLYYYAKKTWRSKCASLQAG